MSDDSPTPVNLNRARKARAEVVARQQADENAVRHGRTRAKIAAEAREKAWARAALDAHRSGE